MSPDLDEAEIEFERLSGGLDVAAALAFAQHRATAHGLPARRLVHLSAVGELAARYADAFFVDLETLHRRYVRQACQAAGYLHEVLVQGSHFEEVVAVVDERVARLVAAVTPDVRLAHPERVFALANRVGLAEAAAQLVALADLTHECQVRAELAEADPAAARDWVAEAAAVLGCLRRVSEGNLKPRVVGLKQGVHALERRLKDIKTREKETADAIRRATA